MQRGMALLTVLAVYSMFLTPPPASAQSHVVSLSELHQQLASKTEARAKNLADIQRVLSSPPAQIALQKANVNPGDIQKAVAQLTDEELSRVADRARLAEKDVEGGFIVGLLALIGLVVVILVVLAVIND
jgi:hypothetical protein